MDRGVGLMLLFMNCFNDVVVKSLNAVRPTFVHMLHRCVW